MIAYRKKFIRIVECWNGEEPNSQGADLTRRFQQTHPRSEMLNREFYTVLIDLNRDSETLFANMKRGTRYEIRRGANQDHLRYDLWDGSDAHAFKEFCEYCDEFLEQKRQPKLDRRWLSLLAGARLLVLSRVGDTGGESLVWHAYHCSPQRATLLYSASLFRRNQSPEYRNKVGRANRYLHWEDMLRFKSAGISTYDFGGWYEGTTDHERLRINKFKEQFGGEVVKNYICEQALTLKGALFLRIRTSLLGNAI
jgi:lipid II:glycine glycyltransferase (peptidoglycan interpeptide bridge formation enzyme)